MRIISWNVNGIRAAVKKGFCEKLVHFKADIVGIQETRANDMQVKNACSLITDYHRFSSSAQKPGYSGVALFSKVKPKKTALSLHQEEFDREGRFICAYFDSFTLINAYFPNGSGPRDNSRVPYKLAFYEALFDYADKLKGPIFIIGDFNTAHQEIDLARPKSNQKNSGFLPEERLHFSNILKRGYIDTFRHFYPDMKKYSWWSMRFKARQRNIGWRIDCILTNKSALSMVKDAFIWNDIMGSDHCPIGIDLKI